MKNSCYFVIINTAFLHKSLWNHFIIDSLLISVIYVTILALCLLLFLIKARVIKNIFLRSE